MTKTNPYKGITTEELPDVLTAKHISAHAHISINHVYESCRLKKEAGGLPSFNIGKSVRVHKKDYLEWLSIS